MVSETIKVNSARLSNGETAFVNDHVYVSPPWSERDGTPYIVARIIEFLPPNSTPKKGSRNGASSELSVRLSIYYRPSDVSARAVSDFRLLLAAIHTDVQPVSNVRGKCYVRHRDRIEDVIKWKRLPDHFYFVRFYDPYIKREYEVIRTENVHNIPPSVRKILLSRYEYLLTEREMVADLTDSFRACCVCEQWASSQDSVRCESCKKHYHMACVNPPIISKPAKGYSWVCLPCSMQRHQDVQDKKFLYGNPNGTTSKPKTTAAKNHKPIADLQRADVTFRGWPWRYFGLYTRAEDTLDADDLIFPRAATRVGRNYQANIPTWEEQQELESSHYSLGESEAGPSRHIGVERGHDVGERKHESTIDVICTPSQDLAEYMGEAAALKLPIPYYDVERLDQEVFAYTTLGRDKALRVLRALNLDDFRPVIFDVREEAVFEAQLEEQGGLDTHKTAHILGRTPSDVLRYSYIWKNRKLKFENEALRAHLKVTHSHARQNRTLGAPSLGRIRARGSSSPLDDEVSLYNEGFVSSNKMQCAACSTRISSVWWRCPRTVPGNAMCENCGPNYRKYGVISFVKSEDSKKVSDKEKQLKRKIDGGSGASTPVPAPPKLPPCACCRKQEPKAAMARCKNCTFSAHAGCYGIASQDMGSNWLCELCTNLESENNSFDPHCVLCPRDISAVIAKNRSKKPPLDFDLLSALKPTEGNQWAHVLCSAWQLDVLYRNAKTLKAIEGITTLTDDRWEETCSLCGQWDGAIIYCLECGLPVHASCAWLSGYRLGFEFTLAKTGKREVVTITKFKEGEGVMHAVCCCKGHDLEGRVIYDMHEIDPEQNETALQVYTAAYKSLPPDDTFALLRKATRLDTVLTYPSPPMSTAKQCVECGIDVSPKWHKLPEDEDRVMVADNPRPIVNGHIPPSNDGEDHMDVDEKPSIPVPRPQQLLCHLCWFNQTP